MLHRTRRSATAESPSATGRVTGETSPTGPASEDGPEREPPFGPVASSSPAKRSSWRLIDQRSPWIGKPGGRKAGGRAHRPGRKRPQIAFESPPPKLLGAEGPSALSRFMASAGRPT